MNELEIESEKPLLVVKYVWWRVLFRNMVLIIGMLGFYSIYKIMLKDGNLLLIIPLIVSFAILVIIALNFLSQKIIFFEDRVEKRWSFFGFYTICYLDALLKVIQVPLLGIFIFFRESSSKFKKINIQLEFFQKSDQDKIIEVVEKITDKKLDELIEYTYWSSKKIKGAQNDGKRKG